MRHPIKPNQNKLSCYLVGTGIGFIISSLFAYILTDSTKITDSAFLDVHAGSLFTTIIYAFIIGDAQKLIKKAEGNYSILLFPIIVIAGVAPIINWILSIPVLILLSPFLGQWVNYEFSGIYFIYGGSNMLGFYFLYKNSPSKYDRSN